MLANFFNKSKPVNYIVVLGLFLGYFLIATFQQFSGELPIGNVILSSGKTLVLFFFLFLVIAFILSKNELTSDNSYAFLFFVIGLGIFPEIIVVSKVFYIHLIILFFLRKLYSLKSSKAVLKKMFDGGFWLGIAFVMEPFTIVYMLLLYGGIYAYQKINFQTLLTPVVGFLVPVFLYFTYCFWFAELSSFDSLFYWFTSYDFSSYSLAKITYPFLLIGFFVIIAVFAKTSKVVSVSNTFRKTWFLIVLNTLVAGGLILFLRERNGSEIVFLLFPVALILANGMEMLQKQWLKELLLIVFLISSVGFKFL